MIFSPLEFLFFSFAVLTAIVAIYYKYKLKKCVRELKKHLKEPIYSAQTYKSIISNEVFGPVDKLYIEYYNDLYESNNRLEDKINKI